MNTSRRGRAKVVLWQSIVDHFVQAIADGLLAPGEQLPPEPRLIERFGVSRNTIRRAMAELEERGLVRIGQGQGTFVADRSLLYPISRRTRFSPNLAAEGREAKTELLSMERRRAGTDAESLAIGEDEPILVVHSRSWADDTPLSIATMHYPLDRFPGLEETRALFDSQTKLLAHYGIGDYVRLKTFLSARPPTEEEARLLHIPRSRWVMQTLKIDADVAGVPVAVSKGRWSADRIEFVIDGQVD